MKKVLLLSFFIVAATLMTSCTAEPVSAAASPALHADDTGGQTLPTHPTKP